MRSGRRDYVQSTSLQRHVLAGMLNILSYNFFLFRYHQTTRTHLGPRSNVSYKTFVDEEEEKLMVDLHDDELDDEAKGKNNLIVDLGDQIRRSPATML